jgi:hypothetical protein
VDATVTSLAELLADPPVVHRDGAGNRVTWQASDEVLRVIDGHVHDGSRTIETGEGLTTILFALKRAHHICVSPNEEAIGLIKAYCERKAIATDRLRFEVDCSENVLPRLKLKALDLVLIDGRHGFPAPFIDWHYTAAALKAGGLVIVDDTQIWTGQVLREFLIAEPEWELVHDFWPRSAIFVKTREGDHAKEWVFQPFVAERQLGHHGLGSDVRRTIDLVRGGELRTLTQNAARRARRYLEGRRV